MKKYKHLKINEREDIRRIIEKCLSDAQYEIERKTGYLSELNFSILEDTLRKSLDIDLDIALLVKPHFFNENKVKHYIKFNPDNVLNEPILAFQYNNWYEIYNGVHRTEANRRVGNRKIKAKLIVPEREAYEKRDAI